MGRKDTPLVEFDKGVIPNLPKEAENLSLDNLNEVATQKLMSKKLSYVGVDGKTVQGNGVDAIIDTLLRNALGKNSGDSYTGDIVVDSKINAQKELTSLRILGDFIKKSVNINIDKRTQTAITVTKV